MKSINPYNHSYNHRDLNSFQVFFKLAKTVVFFTFVYFAVAANNFAKPDYGNLMGFVYGEDGKSPIPDAVVLIKSMETNKIYQSEPAAKTGDYRIMKIEAGNYILGLKIKEKTFNVDSSVKITAGNTEFISLSLEPELEETLLSGQGWCCYRNKVYKSTGEECNKRGGDFFATRKEAREHCGEPLLAFFKTPNGIAAIVVGSGVMTIFNKLMKKYYYEETSPTEK